MTDQRKIFAKVHHINDFYPKYIKKLLKPNNKKIGKRLEKIFHHTRHTDGKLAYEKMFNILSH